MSEENKDAVEEEIDASTKPNAEGQGEDNKDDFQERLDKALSARLARERENQAKEKEKLLADFEARLKREKQEAEKLATMTAEEKAQELAKQREAELTQKEREILTRENRLYAGEKLREKGISSELVDFVLADSQDDIDSKVSILEAKLSEELTKRVEAKLAGSTPKDTKATSNVKPEIRSSF